jgi:hypothetical protein
MFVKHYFFPVKQREREEFVKKGAHKIFAFEETE